MKPHGSLVDSVDDFFGEVRTSSPLSATSMKNSYKTCKRFNDAGHAHCLTFSCFRCQPFLDRDRSRRWLVDSFDRARRIHSFHLWAYVIMPEHAHLLIWPTQSNYDISKILASIKLSVTRKALTYVKTKAPSFLPRMLDQQAKGRKVYRFWQRGGGYDRNVIEPRTVWAQIDYLHANPVRRELCTRPEDWCWSSAANYADINSGPLALDRDSLPRTDAG